LMSIETLDALVVLMKTWEDGIKETREGLAELARLAHERKERLGR